MHFGKVRLQIKGNMPEKMLNIAAKRGYYFQNVIQTDKNIIEGEIDVKNYRKLRPVARKARCRIHILERKGPAFFVEKCKRRKTFFFCGICSMVILFVFANRLTTIDIKVPPQISKQEVLQYLQTQQVKPGTWVKTIDDEKLTMALKNHFDEQMAWAEVTLQGNTLLVEGAGFTGQPNIIPYTQPCDLIAEKSGVITSIDVKNGVKKVEIGQTVSAGDLLISGTVGHRYDETDTYQVHAHGTVMVSTWYEAYQVVNMLEEVRTRTGNVARATVLEILDFSIPLSSTQSPYAAYDQLQESKQALLFGKIKIPITLHKYTWLECEEDVREMDGDVALERAKQQAYAKCLEQIPDTAQVEKIKFSYKNTQNDGICVVVIVECIESIGVSAPITGG